MTSFSRLQTLLPAVVLVALVALALGVGYYFASANSGNGGGSGPAVTWSVNHLKLKFAQRDGSGSAPDSFTCSSTVSPVTLQATSGRPDIVTVTVSPSAFASCGSTPDNVSVTATCTATALASGTCKDNGGDASVVVCGPTPYTCLQVALVVEVVVS